MAKRMALGKGLGALIPDAVRDRGDFFICGIEEIAPNPNQPRKRFDEEKIEELAASIREKGILEPLVVRKSDEGYELIIGERRWRAAQKAGLTEVPVVLKDVTDRESLEMALIENLQREDLGILEEAEGYRQLIEEFTLTQEELAKRIGKDRTSVTNTLRLLRLPDEVKEHLSESKLSPGHGRALLALPTEEDQREACRAIIEKDLTVRETERLVKRWKRKKENVLPSPGSVSEDPDLQRIQEDLRRFLSTQVHVSKRGKVGTIQIQFYSSDDLERLVDLIMSEKGAAR